MAIEMVQVDTDVNFFERLIKVCEQRHLKVDKTFKVQKLLAILDFFS